MAWKNKTRLSAKEHSASVPERANRILNIILVMMVLILVRIWHLAVVQYDSRLEDARRPQQRTTVERAERATIRDRFNLPLALNKVQYNAAILYSQIREIPAVQWEIAPDGKKIKHFRRREHIASLAELLARQLELDPERLEDLIHAKASLFPNTPFVVKSDISEEQYYRLKMLEKDWLGIHVERLSKRYYPQGRVASDIIGYIGPISREEYEAIAGEIKMLEGYVEKYLAGDYVELPEGFSSTSEVRQRLAVLQERAYSIHDDVGKTGVEGAFEEDLRGFRGKRVYQMDIYGNFVRELPSVQEPLPGQRLLLSISSELQECAERLLTENEKMREKHSYARDSKVPLKQPWIKGGAIVAMDPNTGEVLALASYPRFDPNDFISTGHSTTNRQRSSNVLKWLESDGHVAEIWDQKKPLERENFSIKEGVYYDEQRELSWEAYLNFILAENSPVTESLNKIENLGNCIAVQRAMKQLLAASGIADARMLIDLHYSGEKNIPFSTKWPSEARQNLGIEKSEVVQAKRLLDRYLSGIPYNYDKLLVIDLCRLAADEERFTETLLSTSRDVPLSAYKTSCAAYSQIGEVVKEMAKELFHDLDFRTWKTANQQKFIQSKRALEKEQHKYPKPYLDYLDQKESEMFDEFWEKYRVLFSLAFLSGLQGQKGTHLEPYLDHFSAWHEEIVRGAHMASPWRDKYLQLQQTMNQFELAQAAQFLRSMRSYRELNRPLLGKYRLLKSVDGKQLEKHLAAAFYPKNGFGYGRSQAYRQAASQGSVFKLVIAYEALVQRYHQLADSGDDLSDINPFTFVDEPHPTHSKRNQWNVGYTNDGRAIPQYYKGGRMLLTQKRNVGKIDVAGALEASSNSYFALLAVDILHDPEDINRAASQFSYGSRTGIDLPGEYPGALPKDLSSNPSGLYSVADGQHSLVVTPLQAAVMISSIANGGSVFKPKIVNLIAGKELIRDGDEIWQRREFAFQETLNLLGIDFPLFISAEKLDQKGLVQLIPNEVQRQVDLPEEVRDYILEGMRRVIVGKNGGARVSLMRHYPQMPWLNKDYEELQFQMLGKTSTAEAIEQVDLDPERGASIYNHIWFAGISFEQDQIQKRSSNGKFPFKYGKPELVVIVYLRYGDYGREAALVAAQVVKKWREIKIAHEKTR